MTNQQLKAHCEDVIANPQGHPDWVVDMARVTLASLGAEPVVVRCRYHPTPQCDGKWIYIPQAEYIKDETGKYQEQALYTAPPVKELKIPGVSELIAISDCTPSVSDVLLWDACVAEVKRLNGVKS